MVSSEDVSSEDAAPLVNAQLVSLVVAGTMSQASQYLLSYLFSVPEHRGGKYSIRAALDLSPYFFSMLVGYTLCAPRALTQFMSGRLGRSLPAQSVRVRATVLALALIFQAMGTWTLATASKQGGCAQVVAAQAIVGLGSGPLFPLGYAMIAQSYEAHELGSANGVYSMTSYLGPALASLSVVVARAYGWRVTARAVAASLAVSAAFVVVCAEENHVTDSEPVTKPIQRIRPCHAVASACLLALGGGVRYAADYASMSYVPYFFEARYPSEATMFSTCNALALFACGSSSALAGGALSQRVAARLRNPPFDYLAVPMVSCILGALFTTLTFGGRGFACAIVALFAMQLFGEAWLAGTIAALHQLVDDDLALGGLFTSATFLGSLNLVIIGVALDKSHASLRLVLTFTVAVPYVVALALFLFVAKLATPALLTSSSKRGSSSLAQGSSTSTRRYIMTLDVEQLSDSAPLLPQGGTSSSPDDSIHV